MNNRIIIFTNDNGLVGSLKFNSEELKDSEAFKELICTTDPGETYSVIIRNYIPATCWCEHSNHFNDSRGPRIKHEYTKADSDGYKAAFVGDICDDCAEFCMYDFIR